MTLDQHIHQKLRHNRIFEECSTMGKLINRIPGSCILISSLPGSASRTHVESRGLSTCILEALPGKLDIKRHSPNIPKYRSFNDLIALGTEAVFIDWKSEIHRV